jgi:hypothetical protein
MLWILVASQLSAPVPLNLRNWFDPDDMPVDAMQRASAHWEVGVRVEVDSLGRIMKCLVEATSNMQSLDDLSCRLIKKRAHFRPARWIDGSPIAGSYSTSVAWSVSDTGGPPPPSAPVVELDLLVENLPSRVRTPAITRVMFAVDAMGKVSSCMTETAPNFVDFENFPALVAVACQQLTDGYKANPLTDASGKPIASVQDASVRFWSKRK